MKNLFSIALISLFSLSMLQAANNTVTRETVKGKSVEVNVVSNGSLNLFKQKAEVLPATIPQDPAESYTKTYTTYYVSKGDEDLTELHCANYKKVLREQLKDQPELAGKIGQKGYKFQDIEAIVSSYNQ